MANPQERPATDLRFEYGKYKIWTNYCFVNSASWSVFFQRMRVLNQMNMYLGEKQCRMKGLQLIICDRVEPYYKDRHEKYEKCFEAGDSGCIGRQSATQVQLIR